MYGGSSGSPAERAYCKFFRSKYQGIFKEQTSWTHEVLASKEGELVTDYGMRFYWPGTTVSKSGFIDNTTSIFNFSVQGFATGEIIPIAVVFFWHRINGRDIELVNTIHDSVVVEIAPHEEEFVKEVAIESFTYDVYKFLKDCYGYKFETPLGVEVKLAEHWGEGDGQKHNVFPPHEDE